MKYMRLLPSFGLLCLTLLAGCADDALDPTKNWTVERFYAEAKTAMAEKNYVTAIKHLETLEARYPYGPYAEQAMLELAYAYYKNEEPASAIATADRFIRLHPTHANVDYAYYLKGLINFEQQSNILERWLRLADRSERDPKPAYEALDSFRELVTRFPESRYTREAAARSRVLVNRLAQHEMNIAQFYFDRGAYVAAVNRAKQVLESFPQSPAIEHALGLQLRSYQRLGLTTLAQDTRRVLTQNFPQSAYLKDAG